MMDAGESEANIAAVIQRLSGRQAPPAPTRGWLSPSTPADFPVVNMAKGALNVVKEIPAATYRLVTDPIGTMKAMGQAQGQVGVQAAEAARRGNPCRRR